MRVLKKLLIALLIILIAGYIFISYSLSNRVLNPQSTMERTLDEIPVYWNTTFEAMMAMLPEPEVIAVNGLEDASIHGQYFTVSDSSQCLFIFSHGWGRNWPNMLKYYPVVSQCGCDVLMYDHRAHGESGGKYPTGGLKESEDLIKITEWASSEKGYNWDQIAWVGSSWGAAAVLMAGAKNQNPAFIVADSPFQDWFSAVFERAIEDYGSGIKAIAPGVFQVVNMRAGVNYKDASPVELTKQITEPVLLFHSEADPETNAEQSVNIAKNLNDQSEFHLTQWGNEHVMDVINNKEEIEMLIMNFIEKHELSYFQPAQTALDSVAVN